ncbi:polyprotein [Sesbania bispinosa]|nr:polyprotein [Sesbania bispinosa]
MPKKATNLASSRGRGVRLALPGSFNQTSTKSGSSTQQPNPSGSPTQQQNPSSQTAKQTKADYAFPIQTLLALQDCGLTHLPKKTWADIASEEDEDESQTNLAILINQLAESQTVANDPKQKKIISTPIETQVVQTQNPISTQKPQNHYISKNKFSSVIQMEPEFWDSSPHKVPSKVFPEGFHFRPYAKNKTRQFYEFILVDSDSVTVKHYKDQNDSSHITHSTIQILRVLTPSQYGKNPNSITKFSQNFDPIGYNYWDYMDAWTRVFWQQNKNNRHSWLIYFKRNTQYNFPNWFLQWWDFFGPIEAILPSSVNEGLKQFYKMYGKQENKNYLPILQRNAYVKWWALFDHSKNPPREFLVQPLRQPLPETSIKMKMTVSGFIWEKTKLQG